MSNSTKGNITIATFKLTGAQPEKPYRANTARDLVWCWLVQYASDKANHVKPGQVCLTSATLAYNSAPPSTPKSGKLAGKPEPLAGWLSYFRRAGLLTAGQATVPADYTPAQPSA